MMRSIPLILLFFTPLSLASSPLGDGVKIDPVTHQSIPYDRLPDVAFSACFSMAILLISAWLLTVKGPNQVLLTLAISANLLLLAIDAAWMIG